VVHVHRSTIIDAPVDAVWALLRDFNGHERWHPAIAESRIEGGRRTDQLAAVRNFALRQGGRLRERLIALSDRDRTLTYAILDSPLPLFGYVASMRAKAVTDGRRTFLEWWSDFETTLGREDELASLVARDIYEAGFDAVKRAFGQTAPPHSAEPRAWRPPAQPSRTGAVVIERYGGPEVLVEREVTLPPPSAREVLIRHTAIGLNYIDVYCRTGYFRLIEPPGVPGMEAAGVIEAVGEGVHAFREGDRVGYAAMPPGAYAERRTMAADLLVLLPDTISDEEAAAGLLKGMTAEFLLHRIARVKEGDTVLVHAAAGGVGLILCQWARAKGATVIGTVSTEQKAVLARRNGCVYPIVVPRDDVAERVREVTGGAGCSAVFDAIGRDTIAASIACLSVRGHLVSYGQASGHIEPVDIAGLAARSLTISRPNFGDYAGTPDQVRSITDRHFAAHARGEVRFKARQRFALRQAAAAHRALESRATMGSTILIP
jgi:NADPH:quinone reductase-like Zn-dependent oxidoreductase